MDEQYDNEPMQTPPPEGRPVYVEPAAGRTAAAYVPQPSQAPVHTPAPAPAPAPRRQGKGYLVGIVAIVAVCVVVLASIMSCTSTVNAAIEGTGLVESKSSSQPDSSPKVGVIQLDGAIQYDGTSSSPDGLKTLLDQASGRKDIKAVVLVVNSGGGIATAGEEMSRHIKQFDKPLVVCSEATNASAAYEISSQADYIFTAKTTAIGSIGVSLEITDLSGLYELLGIKVENITSAESKDSSYGNRPLTEEERAWYQSMVDQISDDFIATVAEGRGMTVERVRELANGLTYTGTDAVEVGLADEIGYFDEAVAKASSLAESSSTLPTTNLTLSSPSGLSSLIDLLGESKSTGEADMEALARKLSSESSK